MEEDRASIRRSIRPLELKLQVNLIFMMFMVSIYIIDILMVMMPDTDDTRLIMPATLFFPLSLSLSLSLFLSLS